MQLFTSVIAPPYFSYLLNVMYIVRTYVPPWIVTVPNPVGFENKMASFL
jgi:hypothetical protein